jgi:N-acetylmuramoyl-L-alanine amidase
MPAVLLELGFISNPADLAALKKADERQKIAERLFEALKDYKTLYDSSVKLGGETAKAESAARVEQPEEQKQAVSGETKVLYGTQIFATSRRLDPEDKRLLGWKPQIIQIKSLYKYIIGISESPEEARKNYEQIRLSYPGCFMVVISDGETSRYN